MTLLRYLFIFIDHNIVIATSLNSFNFKNRLDSHWKNQEIFYDYKASIKFCLHGNLQPEETKTKPESSKEDDWEPVLEIISKYLLSLSI